MKISNIKKGNMGTIVFDAKFNGMRKDQGFVVYPLAQGDLATRIKVQSDTRIGFIELTSGRVLMSLPVASGAHNQHLALAKEIDTLNSEELLLLKAGIMGTADKHAGLKENGIMHTDNSGAINAMGAVTVDDAGEADAPDCAP